MRTITVLLTKYSDWISNLVYHIGGRGYTHASLALGEDENTYYSFNYHGFCVETLEKHRHRGVEKSLSYQLRISDEAYDNIKECIEQMKIHRSEFQYTRIGVLFCILRIPFKWNHHYFCSQFVAEIMMDSGAVKLKKKPQLYLPNDLGFELEQNKYLLMGKTQKDLKVYDSIFQNKINGSGERRETGIPH